VILPSRGSTRCTSLALRGPSSGSFSESRSRFPSFVQNDLKILKPRSSSNSKPTSLASLGAVRFATTSPSWRVLNVYVSRAPVERNVQIIYGTVSRWLKGRAGRNRVSCQAYFDHRHLLSKTAAAS